jgi:hypothetical protein
MMNSDVLLLCERAERSSAAVLENLAQIEATLRDVQEKLATAPIFVRAFASSEVSRGTGQDIPAWTQLVVGLMAALRDAQAAVVRVRAAGVAGEADRALLRQVGARVAAEQPRLEALVGFMQKAPDKITRVPALLFPAEQRDEVLGAIARQVAAMQSALAAMPDLAASLRTLGGEST